MTLNPFNPLKPYQPEASLACRAMQPLLAREYADLDKAGGLHQPTAQRMLPSGSGNPSKLHASMMQPDHRLG